MLYIYIIYRYYNYIYIYINMAYTLVCVTFVQIVKMVLAASKKSLNGDRQTSPNEDMQTSPSGS